MKKTAIVTGASRGIGRVVAKRLARYGFAVVVNYLSNASEAEEVVAEIKGIGGEAIAVKADVADQTEVEQLFEETLKEFGSIDVVDIGKDIPMRHDDAFWLPRRATRVDKAQNRVMFIKGLRNKTAAHRR